MAAVLEFLCAELLEVAGEECLNKKRKIIKPRHFETSIRIDPELGRLFQNRTFINGGTAPLNPGQ
jgi:histone H2A